MKKRKISSWRGSLRTHLLGKKSVLIVAIQKVDLAAHSLEGRESYIGQGDFYHITIKTMVKLFCSFIYLGYLSETCDSPVGLLLEPQSERKGRVRLFIWENKEQMEMNECDLR